MPCDYCVGSGVDNTSVTYAMGLLCWLRSGQHKCHICHGTTVLAQEWTTQVSHMPWDYCVGSGVDNTSVTYAMGLLCWLRSGQHKCHICHGTTVLAQEWTTQVSHMPCDYCVGLGVDNTGVTYAM